ncbi:MULTISPECIES: hypothetical protein [Asticcacaulis]|uniref:hypothetical protein n=1 Tax=Asticcacaulis TaxID=76890 RepID=UPI001AE414BC|nr:MULTISPECIES: hypothetical protein [Asticcacaulis]MBP2161765.1 hypothetical protein [Asticcacaulis solisilvae]MDR6802811.1 hypothetical protein [Asticcacaulis sp. BE141]
MLGLFLKREHFGPVLAAALAVGLIGIVIGMSNGAFESNNREALRLKREAAAAQVAP